MLTKMLAVAAVALVPSAAFAQARMNAEIHVSIGTPEEWRGYPPAPPPPQPTQVVVVAPPAPAPEQVVYVPPPAPPPPTVVVVTQGAPPPPYVEHRTPVPCHGAVWLPGAWRPHKHHRNRWVWYGGRWDRDRDGRRWDRDGDWRDGRYQQAVHWRRHDDRRDNRRDHDRHRGRNHHRHGGWK